MFLFFFFFYFFSISNSATDYEDRLTVDVRSPTSMTIENNHKFLRLHFSNEDSHIVTKWRDARHHQILKYFATHMDIHRLAEHYIDNHRGSYEIQIFHKPEKAGNPTLAISLILEESDFIGLEDISDRKADSFLKSISEVAPFAGKNSTLVLSQVSERSLNALAKGLKLKENAKVMTVKELEENEKIRKMGFLTPEEVDSFQLATGSKAVIDTSFVEIEANESSIFDEALTTTLTDFIDASLLPKTTLYSYKGSHTAPPCEENVLWFVRGGKPMRVFGENLNRLRDVMEKTFTSHGNWRISQNDKNINVQTSDDESHQNGVIITTVFDSVIFPGLLQSEIDAQEKEKELKKKQFKKKEIERITRENAQATNFLQGTLPANVQLANRMLSWVDGIPINRALPAFSKNVHHFVVPVSYRAPKTDPRVSTVDPQRLTVPILESYDVGNILNKGSPRLASKNLPSGPFDVTKPSTIDGESRVIKHDPEKLNPGIEGVDLVKVNPHAYTLNTSGNGFTIKSMATSKAGVEKSLSDQKASVVIVDDNELVTSGGMPQFDIPTSKIEDVNQSEDTTNPAEKSTKDGLVFLENKQASAASHKLKKGHKHRH